MHDSLGYQSFNFEFSSHGVTELSLLDIDIGRSPVRAGNDPRLSGLCLFRVSKIVRSSSPSSPSIYSA